MEYRTPVKRPRTAESYSANHIYYGNGIRVDGTTSYTRHVLSKLQQAVTSKQRMSALHEFLNAVRYDPSTRMSRSHAAILSQFLEGKCIHILCLQLGYTLSRHYFDSRECDSQINHPDEEVKLILIALDIFYRQCPELATEDSIRNNAPEVLRLLQEVMKIHPGRTANTRSIVSIWHSFSSCNPGTILLLQNPQTLQAISNILSTQKQQPHHNTLVGTELILECLGLLKNLSYYGEDYRYLIINQRNLISTLTSLTDVPHEKARERLSAVFRNLALSADVRPELTQRADVLAAIVRLFVYCTPKSNIMDNSNSKKGILRNVLSTVTSLAVDTSATHFMVYHGDGIIMDQLKRFVIHDKDCVARKRAIRAIKLLVRDPSSTPVIVLQNNQLLQILSDRALNDVDDSVRTEAIEAFSKCANLIRPPMAQHNFILEALTHILIIATAKLPMVTANLDIVARAFQEQASYQASRKAMIQQRNLLKTFANVLCSEKTTLGTKECVCATLVDLSEENFDVERNVLAIILDALVKNIMKQPNARAGNSDIAITSANIESIVMNRIRERCVQTILNLAKTPSNRKKMAQQTMLIQSLLQFAAAITTGEDLKKRVKVVIIQLATEL